MHLKEIIFSISHFIEKTYEAIWFSPLQGKKTQMFACVYFFTLKLGGHSIFLSAQGKIIK